MVESYSILYIYTHTHTHTHIYTYIYIYIYTHTYIHTCHIFFIHSPADRHLGCFCVLAIVNSAAMNTGMHVSFGISVFAFSWHIPRGRTAGSYGSSICRFLRNLYTVLHSGYTNLHHQQQCTRILFSLHPHQHLLSVPFWQVWGDISLWFWFATNAVVPDPHLPALPRPAAPPATSASVPITHC